MGSRAAAESNAPEVEGFMVSKRVTINPLKGETSDDSVGEDETRRLR